MSAVVVPVDHPRREAAPLARRRRVRLRLLRLRQQALVAGLLFFRDEAPRALLVAPGLRERRRSDRGLVGLLPRDGDEHARLVLLRKVHPTELDVDDADRPSPTRMLFLPRGQLFLP